MKLCVLVPAYNCAPFLPELVSRTPLPGDDDEIIIVDDASQDDTYAVASSLPRVFADRNPRNLGYGGTSKRLFELALEREARLVINIHGDLGHDPEGVGGLYARLIRGDSDLVLGSRLLFLKQLMDEHGWVRLLDVEARHNMPLLRVGGQFGLTWFQNLCFGTNLHSFHEGMRGVTREVMAWVLRSDFPDWYDFDTQLIIHAHRHGFKIAEVPVAPSYHNMVGSAAPPFRYGWRVLINTVRLACGRDG